MAAWHYKVIWTGMPLFSLQIGGL